MKKNLLIAAALTAAAVGGIAVAAETMVGHRGPMAADTDRDGAVSRSEYFKAAETRFTRHDANNDRMLTSGEYQGPKMQRQDSNGDGKISFAEATAAASARFKARDGDKDGKLTAEEMRPDGPGGRGMREMGGRMLRHADTNRDGKIGRDEMRAQSDQRFDRLDANKDGLIDRDELNADRGPGRPGPGRDAPPPPEDDGE